MGPALAQVGNLAFLIPPSVFSVSTQVFLPGLTLPT